MGNPSILTLILNYKTPEMTLKAAETALREMDGLNGEMIIVDNASGDGSFEEMRDEVARRGWRAGNRVRVLQSGRNGGFGAGNNFGIRQGLTSGIEPDFVYILNSDAFPDPGAISTLVNELKRSPKLGIAGSRVRGPDGVPHITGFRFPSVLGEFEGAVRTGVFSKLLANSIVAIPVPEKSRDMDWVAGASMMLRYDMLRDIGLFDEAFFLYFEETDLCRRASLAGWSTRYVVESDVMHIGSVSTGMKVWSRMPQYWFDSRLHYFTKNHGVTYTLLSSIALVFGGAIYRLRRMISDKPQRDPDHFLWDFFLHSLRRVGAWRPRIKTRAPAISVLKDTESS